MEVQLVAAGVNPQRLGNGSSLMDRVMDEGTKFCLFAYPYLRKASGSFWRVLDNLKKNKGARIVVDSGGFELAEGTAHGIDAADVIRLQNSVAYMGFILDFPPDHKPFDWCLNLTSKHVQEAAGIEKSFQYYLVVHGRDMGQMKEWYGELKDRDKYDGISVSGIEFSELLRGFIFAAMNEGWPRWHFLGTSSITQVSLIHYLSKMLLKSGRTDVERITFDSTTPTQFGRVCKTFHPCAPVEVIEPRNFSSEFLRRIGNDFDGSASSCILTNIKCTVRYSDELHAIDTPEGLTEYVEVLLGDRKLREKWRLGKRIIDTVFEKGEIAALKLIPPELDRVAGLKKSVSILTL